MTRPAALVRLALIILTTVGVAWMHTFGHSSSHDHTTMAYEHGGAAHGSGIAMSGLVTQAQAATPACHDGCPDTLGMDPFSVCLAVLGSLGLLLLLAAAWLTRARAHPAAWLTAAAPWTAGRGPPGLLLGLRLTRLSVLRT